MNFVSKLLLITFLVNVLIQDAFALTTMKACECLDSLEALGYESEYDNCADKIRELKLSHIQPYPNRPRNQITQTNTKSLPTETATISKRSHQPRAIFFEPTLEESKPLPECISSLKSLKKMTVYTITDPNIAPLKLLKELTFCSYNRKSIPESIKDLPVLQKLYVHGTLMEETPNFLGNVTSLEHLALEDNRLSGPIPEFFKNLINLKYLNLGFNEYTDLIPDYLTNFEDLEYLYLNDNNLYGEIPDIFDILDEIINLKLQQNNLTGPIPESICSFKNISEINLSDNELTGTIPDCVGNLVTLHEIVLRNNKLSGQIPDSITKLNKMDYLALNNNNLSGSIPSEIDKMESLEYMFLQYNNLTGPIPESIGNLKNILTISLYNNKLTGILPESIKNIQSLKYLDLQNNPDLYGYTIEHPGLSRCNYTNTNICYKTGSVECTHGAMECTEEQIKKIERVRLGLDPNGDDEKECWATALGYSCCNEEDSKTVYFVDSEGEWGINSDVEWCGIIRNEPYKCEAEKLGYKCCSESVTKVVMTEDDIDWGYENNEWCGFVEKKN